MGTFRLAALIAGEWAVGLALLSFASAASLRAMSRWEKLGASLLLGLSFVPFVALLALLAGMGLSGWWWTGTCAAGLIVLLWRRTQWPHLWISENPASPLLPGPVRWYAAVGFATLVVWVLMAAVFLPTLDYDGLATWSYRTRVLLAERHLYVEALRDPVRFVPMRQHPYLLPVMEAGHGLALGGFSFAATHVPHVLACAGFLMLAMAAVRRQQLGGDPTRALALLGALILMPAAGIQLSMESVREVIIGYYGLGAVYFLARWAEAPRWTFILCAAAFGLTAQQIKVEGVPFILGLALGSGMLLAESDRRIRALRAKQWAVAVGMVSLLAVPWWMVLSRLPESNVHGYDFSADLDVTLTDRLQAVPAVARLVTSEFLLRPELYGLTPYAVLIGLVYGWSRRNALVRLALLAAPGACLAGILVVYIGRNDRLPPERNVTFSRRMMCVIPAMTFAALYLPRKRRERHLEEIINSDHPESRAKP